MEPYPAVDGQNTVAKFRLEAHLIDKAQMPVESISPLVWACVRTHVCVWVWVFLGVWVCGCVGVGVGVVVGVGVGFGVGVCIHT
jgi:hypothetical protein